MLSFREWQLLNESLMTRPLTGITSPQSILSAPVRSDVSYEAKKADMEKEVEDEVEEKPAKGKKGVKDDEKEVEVDVIDNDDDADDEEGEEKVKDDKKSEKGCSKDCECKKCDAKIKAEHYFSDDLAAYLSKCYQPEQTKLYDPNDPDFADKLNKQLGKQLGEDMLLPEPVDVAQSVQIPNEDEPQPGQVGFAPQGRVGTTDLSSLSAWAEWSKGK